MNARELKIDTYIENAAPFAQPILRHLRELIHKTCPEVQETWKWSFPHFDYKGSILCSMGAFKNHCAFTFFKYSLMEDPEGIFQTVGKSSMGQLGQIRDLKDIPGDKILGSYIKQAMKLNETGVKLPGKSKPAGTVIAPDTPDYFLSALKANSNAKLAFDEFSPGKRKEYIEWLEEARTEATRNKRLATAIEWISEGKSRHWKYQK
ncbi:MAG: hypothetical protein EOP49_10965 [Sphingobacteriales bacterium]|nr:MAG: hypothetical protein EOP49_10965 [Sphingobacteriales bacterium]